MQARARGRANNENCDNDVVDDDEDNAQLIDITAKLKE